jgi:predicted nucleic acid-binding protein
MADPVLYDAVTLRHFAAISRLDLLECCHGMRAEPRWVAGVKLEIEAASLNGRRECRPILEYGWLGEAVEPTVEDLAAITRLQIALGNAGYEAEDGLEVLKHRGEAESIQIAQRLGFCFVTDDNDAHKIASLRLGDERVFDTIDLLRIAVANTDLTAPEAVEVSLRIRSEDRHFRRQYERLLISRDFL